MPSLIIEAFMDKQTRSLFNPALNLPEGQRVLLAVILAEILAVGKH